MERAGKRLRASVAWIARHCAIGCAVLISAAPDGLINAKSPGRPPKLSKEQMEELGRLVESGPTHGIAMG
jgi:hypothetical protein